MAKKKSKKSPASSRRKPAGRARKAPSKKRMSKKPARRRSAASSMPKPKHGDWAWHELMTTNVEIARRFYASLFGWSFNDMPMGDFNYSVIRSGGKDAGGMMPMEGPQWQGVPPHWMIYVTVDDVDATAARCKQLGGDVCVPPTDIPVGRFAVLNDPTGATISIYKSNMR